MIVTEGPIGKMYLEITVVCPTKMVWEPMDLQKKYPRRNSESDIAMLSASLKEDVKETSVVPSLSINNCSGETYIKKSQCEGYECQ